MARLCDSLTVLRDQINWEWPPSIRSTASDGWIGDASHQKNPTSDHNPNSQGVVRAIDVTNDPKSGCLGQVIAERLRTHRDPRVKYVIYNRQMFSHYRKRGHGPFVWRPYTGDNPHTTHVHISVRADPERYDNDNRWEGFYTAPGSDLTGGSGGDHPPLTSKEIMEHTIGKRDPNKLAVRRVQTLLVDWDPKALPKYGIDGDYGSETAKAVTRFQKTKNLDRDGVVDPTTLYWLTTQPAKRR